MEGLGVNPEFWHGKRVFVTGHTGFKGAWAAFWLREMGAQVFGYALPPENAHSLHDLLRMSVPETLSDLNDRPALDKALAEAKPDIILHLAAQALVRRSYREPVATFATNVIGTVNLMDAARACDGLRAIVVATSDKAYENVEQVWGYRETDPMGGRDPYSASKGACEIAAASMRASFYQPFTTDGHPARVATVRAGNVIGGGDWSEDRLVPDIVKGCLGPDAGVTLRSPKAVRPWQHVLEPIRGYLAVAERLHAGDDTAASAYNFGPDRIDEREVIDVANAIVSALGTGKITIDEAAANLHEAKLLTLDCSKARAELNWAPAMGFADCVRFTADWYGGWHRGDSAEALCRAQIAEYTEMFQR